MTIKRSASRHFLLPPVLTVGGGPPVLAQALSLMSLSCMPHRSVPGGDCIDASPDRVFVLKFALTRTTAVLCVSPNRQDPGRLPSILPVPANGVGVFAQMNRYCPVNVLINNLLPGLPSSSRQTLNAVTVNEQVAVLPEASVAVQVTVVVPTGNGVPEGGTHATVTPGQLSVATGGGNVATAVVAIGQLAGATAITLAGHVIVGGCVSTTVMVNMHCR